MSTTTEPTLLDQLYEKRLSLVTAWTEALQAREAERAEFETRSASDDEATKPSDEQRDAFTAAEVAFEALRDQSKAEITALDARIEDQNDLVRRRLEAAAAHKGNAEIEAEPLTYRRDNGRGTKGISYYRDLACVMVDGATFGTTSRSQSLERLTRHAMEMEVEVPKRVEKREKEARRKVAEAESRGRSSEPTYDPFQRSATYSPLEKRVEPNRTDGYGGFVKVAAA